MLRQVGDLNGYKLGSRDGEIGKVKELYFDDLNWTVRYLVADTGDWLSDRRVLISPYALDEVNVDGKVIPVNLTRKQIENSPSLDNDKPVSRQYELQCYPYYDWPAYWNGPFQWGPVANPGSVQSGWLASAHHTESDDPHLRSTIDVSGHSIQALNGEIGHVEDFVVDDETWTIRYLIVDPRDWWPGKKVLISTRWVERISWSESKVFINLNRETIKLGPEYTKEALITRDYEMKLHRHYGRAGYWEDELARKIAS